MRRTALITLACLAAPPALAQTEAEIEAAHRECQTKFTGNSRAGNFPSLYAKGWEFCADIAFAKSTARVSRQAAEKAVKDEARRVEFEALAKKLKR